MSGSEWSLVFFTLITQMCVGAFILQYVLLNSQSQSGEITVKMKNGILKTLVPFMIIAVVLSFFHLGKPEHAIYSLDNLQTSWLSREIFMVSFFAIVLILYSFVYGKHRRQASFLKFLGILGIIVGIVLIYSMSKIYTLSSIPVWNTLSTPLEFYTASFLLGGILLMLIIQNHLFKSDAEKLEKAFRKTSTLYLILVILLFLDLSNGFYYHYIDTETHPMADEDPGYIPNLIKIVLHMLSILLIITQFYRFNIKKQISGLLGIRLLFFLIILAEIIGRYGFYVSYVSAGGL